MHSAQPVLTIAFFWGGVIPDTLPAPALHHHSSGDTLTGHVWEGGKMDERARGGGGVRRQGRTSRLSPNVAHFEFP